MVQRGRPCDGHPVGATYVNLVYPVIGDKIYAVVFPNSNQGTNHGGVFAVVFQTGPRSFVSSDDQVNSKGVTVE